MQDGKRILTIPNLLSLLRILLIPVFVILFFSSIDYKYIYSVLILLLSGLTDVVDGYIARKFDMTSEFGKVIDPLADKLTQATVCCCLAIVHKEVIALFAVYFVKELLMGIAGIVIVSSGKTIASSKWFGKAATCVMFAVITALVLFSQYMSSLVISICSVIGLIAVICSFVMYIPEFIKITKKENNNAL